MDCQNMGLLLALRSLAQAGSSFSLLDAAQAELPVPSRCFLHLDAVTSALDLAQTGSLVPFQDFARSGFCLLAIGLAWMGSLLFVFDGASLGAASSLKSFFYTGLLSFPFGCSRIGRRGLSVAQFLDFGPPLFVQRHSKPGVPSLAAGMVWQGPAMPASDHLRLGPMLSCRSSVHIGPAMFLLSYGSIAPLLPIRGYVCMDALLLTYGVAEIRSDAAIQDTVPVKGVMIIDFMPPASGAVWSGSLTSLPGLVDAELSSMARALSHLGLSVPAVGLTCLGLSTALLDLGLPGIPVLVQKFCWAGSFPFVLSGARLDAGFPVLDFVNLEALLFSRQLAHSGFASLLFGKGTLGSALFVPGSSATGLSFLLRSFVQLEMMPPLLDSAIADLPSLLHSFSCVGTTFLLFGCARCESFLLTLDMCEAGSAAAVRSLVGLSFTFSLFGLSRTEFLVPIADLLHLDSSLLTRGFSRSGSGLLALGRIMFGSAPSILDSVGPGPSPPAHSLVCSGRGMSLLDFVTMGSPASLQNGICPAFSSPAPGKSRLGFFTILLSWISTGSFLLLRSSLCMDFLVLALSFGCAESSPSARKGILFDFPLFLFEKTRCGPATSLLDFAMLGLAASVRSFTRLGAIPLLADCIQFEPPVFSKAFACADPALPASGKSRFDPAVFLPDPLHPESSFSLRALA